MQALHFRKYRKMDTPCHCKKCGMIFLNASLFWKHEIEKELCTHLKCDECANSKGNLWPELDADSLVLNDRSFLKVKWQDHYKCVRAMMIEKAKADKDCDYTKTKNYSLWNLSAALYLHKMSKVEPGGCGVREDHIFQEAKPGYQIFYLAKICSHKPFTILYIGPEAEKKIYINQHNGLVDAIGQLSDHLILSIFGY